jgi:hypothetical protein
MGGINFFEGGMGGGGKKSTAEERNWNIGILEQGNAWEYSLFPNIPHSNFPLFFKGPWKIS